jgi:hypothetical protein
MPPFDFLGIIRALWVDLQQANTGELIRVYGKGRERCSGYSFLMSILELDGKNENGP